MTAAELATKVRGWLRIGTSTADEELTQCINACLLDLQSGGVDNLELSDPLIQQAVKDYCKSHYGFDTEAERYLKAYESLKNSLAMNSLYGGLVNLRDGSD